MNLRVGEGGGEAPSPARRGLRPEITWKTLEGVRSVIHVTVVVSYPFNVYCVWSYRRSEIDKRFLLDFACDVIITLEL